MNSAQQCSVCKREMVHAFSALVLRQYTVKYFHCGNCGLITTEDPYWLDEAYRDAVAPADTGLIQRNLAIASRLSVLLYYGFDRQGRYADIAGGYGVLVRLMRDIGFHFFWSDKYCRNDFARGFEVDCVKKPFTALTAFEVLEHVSDPYEWLKSQLLEYGATTVICTTEIYEGPVPPDRSWWYYSFATGQHISFYQGRTLQMIADRLGLRYWHVNGFHLFSRDAPTNRLLLSKLSSRVSMLLSLYVKKAMTSMTFDDHNTLLNRHPANI